MEGLETLTDQQLKTKLLEFGFANLPITDTTRKVLLKKLKIAIDNQKAKTRRETVAVTKFSSDEEVEFVEKPRAKTPNNRRATIAVTEKSSVSKKATNGTTTTTVTNGTNGFVADLSPPKAKTPSRRTSRATPAKHLQEDSDDDDVPQVVPTSSRRSASRTATPTNLGVSETVRTAYKQIEPVAEEIVMEEVTEPIIVTKSSRRKTITTSAVPESRSTPTNFRRTTITTSYNPRNASSQQQQYGSDEAEQVQNTVEINEATTPYLSNFAKRLSTLKAEPLDPGMQKYRESSYSSSAYPRTSVATAGTSSSSSSSLYRKPQGGIMRDLTRTFDRLEKRYRFRTTLYVIAIVLIVIAIYVLFFT